MPDSRYKDRSAARCRKSVHVDDDVAVENVRRFFSFDISGKKERSIRVLKHANETSVNNPLDGRFSHARFSGEFGLIFGHPGLYAVPS